MITLNLLHPSQSTPVQSWTFDVEPVIKIGRSKENDVVVLSSVVSRKHIELVHDGSEWEIVSLGSNGTYVNDRPVKKIKVNDGMIVRLGNSGPKIQIQLEVGDPEKVSQKTESKRSSTNNSDPSKDKMTYLTIPPE
ncbi:FHA domain-containing protein [Aerosakkonemataceae cyanobacterium BLCC-F154]|uniref:FHA domain-containing protein n=1 Tax=Floridaenema fluviatile BLCC-F154 TaxID=3153640 RepID=A0ABV4Y6M0_9CYAN